MQALYARYIHSMALAVVITLLLIGSMKPVSSQQRRIGHNGASMSLQETSTTASSFRYLLLKQTVALWADGRGDIILERDLENLSIPNWTNTTWYFDWPQGNYSQIRAWDTSGPLTVSTSRSGTRIYVTIYFRRSVQIGDNYRFSLAITIGNIAQGSEDNWRAYWFTYPVEPIQEYVQGVTFPSNSTIYSIMPPTTSRNHNYLEWRYTNTPANWQHNIDVRYTLSNTVDVPLFLQKDQPWGDDPYGSYPDDDKVNNVGYWGCFITSAAMIINYHAEKSGSSFRTDPGIFNAWLRGRKLYDGNSFVESSAVTYASENKIPLYIPSPGRIDRARDGTTDKILDDSLKSGNPVILMVRPSDSPSGMHFVVATGKTTVNGSETYKINDPIYGRTTLAERYGNQYNSLRLFSGTPADKRTLSISAHSPVELLVTDPMGRRLGYDPATGITWNEIPAATYSVYSIAPDGEVPLQPLDVKNAFIYVPIEGQYTIKILGTGQGAYTINTFAADWQGRMSTTTYQGTAQAGSAHTETVQYNSYTGLLSPVYLPLIRK